MSLEAIRAVRLQNARPGVVSLVIGPVPRWFEDDEQAIVIPEDCTPEFLDWRPVIGLSLAVFQTKPLPDLTLRVIAAANAAGARFYGAADHTGAYPLTADATDEQARNLRRTWSLLCQS